jgi:hypothetical protein
VTKLRIQPAETHRQDGISATRFAKESAMSYSTFLSQKSVRAVLAASFAMISFSASATVQFDIGTGNGFVGRGDVISHPTLGKNALSVNPEITFSANGAHWEQICYTTQGKGQIKTFRRGNVHVHFTTTTRQAPGNDNISGYLLNGIGNDNTAPTNICPGGNWYPYNGSYPVLIYGADLPPLLIFRSEALQGGWVYDPILLMWTVWNP